MSGNEYQVRAFQKALIVLEADRVLQDHLHIDHVIICAKNADVFSGCRADQRDQGANTCASVNLEHETAYNNCYAFCIHDVAGCKAAKADGHCSECGKVCFQSNFQSEERAKNGPINTGACSNCKYLQ